MKPKQLKKVSDGQIFPYSEALAERPDMVPVWVDGVDPNYVQPKGTGLRGPQDVDDSRSTQLRSALADRDKQLLALQRQIDELSNQNSELNSEVARLTHIISNSDMDEKAPKSSNGLDITESVGAAIGSPERQKMINQAVIEVYEKNDPINFTSQGKPRLPIIEEISGFTDITAAERDMAMAETAEGKKE